MVFRHYRNISFRLLVIATLLAVIYGMPPMQASAEKAIAPQFESPVCNPDGGWMWTTGPFEPDIAAQVQSELAEQGVAAHVEAKSYGEADGCGTYRSHGIDFTIQLIGKETKQWASQPEFADRLLPILRKHGKPGLGNVRLLSDEGKLISSSLDNTSSTSNEIQMDALTTESLAVAPPATEVFTKKVYVIVYDPLLSTGQKLSQYMGWNDYSVINQQTIDLFKRASNNRMNYVVVDTTIKTDGWPELIDGFTYTEQEYLDVVLGRRSPHEPMDANYNKIVSLPQFDICGRVNRGEIDEVWIYNGPYFGFYESTLVGPGGYKYNSSPILNTSCNRLIPIMGPSVERTISEATHNFVHRTEATMTRVYGSWEENRTDHGWDKFGLVKLQSPSYPYSGCGSAHWPPNAVAAEYDYGNSTGTLSNCSDFFNYPNLSDPLQVSQLVTCAAWGCTGHGYNEYWFNHMPSFSGCDSDNVANDWWIYFANPATALSPSSFCPSGVHRISGNTTVAGATLSYTDGISKTTMANIFGEYSLVVSDHWSGTITPSKAGHTFSPAGRSYADVAVNQVNQDYASQGGSVTRYYVNIATGNNSNACTTPAAPCRDIQETLNKANPGAIIHVANGRYVFSTNPSPNVLIINKHVKLSGGWSSDFTSQNGASMIDGANVNNGILVLSGTVVVENFTVENSTSSNSGAIYIVDGNLILKQSTLRNNFATSNGGGIFVDNGTVTVINSTISGNRANGSGGGIFAALHSDTSVSLINSTIAYNQASWGGGISQMDGTFTLANSIVANNSSYISSPDCQGTITANFSLIKNTAGCMIGSGGNNINLDPQLEGSLTGANLVHQPLAGSPVIDAGSLSECQAIDQRRIIRPQGSGCDIGAVEYVAAVTPTATNTLTFTPTVSPTLPPSSGLYLSLTGSQTIGGVATRDEDILKFDGQNWSLFFDGSDAGVGSPDLFAFSILDTDTILMAFSANVTINAIAATPQDVLRFDATSLGSTTSGTWSLYFDGSDVGLETTAEKIDSVSVLPDGRLLISTSGNPAVPGPSGLADEDIIAFTPVSLGDNTSGTWSMYFDGSDVGLSTSSGEDIDALDITSNGNIYLSTLDNFSVTGVSGADEDVFVCAPISLGSNTACTFSSSLYFDGSSWGLGGNDVDAIHVLTTGSVPPSTATPTGTPGSPTATFTPTATPTATATGTFVAPPTATDTPTPTLANPATSTGTPILSNRIFADGFESGGFSAWSSSSTDAGDLSVSAAAALVGGQGMQAVIDDNNVLSVTSDHPNAEAHYLARFNFDPNSIRMANGDSHIILRGYSGSSTIALRVEFGYGASGYQIRAGLLNDGSTWTETGWYPLTDAPHRIQLDWRAASEASLNNGGLGLWIDDAFVQLLTGIDNDTRRIERVLLGALASIDTGTRGTYYFDAFESER